jgi:5'-methylthioadenosine phosphorylase
VIMATLSGNAERGKAMVRGLPDLLAQGRAPCPAGCDHALEYAILTAPEARDPAVMARLDAVAGRVLNRPGG